MAWSYPLPRPLRGRIGARRDPEAPGWACCTATVQRDSGWQMASSRSRLTAMAATGAITAGVTAALDHRPFAPILGWDVGAFVFELWTWLAVGRMDAAATRVHAAREDPSPRVSESLLLIANLASLAAVAYVVVDSTNARGATRLFLGALALFSVAVSWL